MIKSSIIMISAFVLFIAGSSIKSDEKIIINQNFPTSINAGDEFIVSLNVHKSLVKGFARLQQDLPEGFTAEEVESNGADFIFENQSVKLIWVKIPEEKDFRVSYKIKTSKNIIGVKNINGVFVYMENGKAQRHNLGMVEIKINESKVANAPQVTRRLLTVAPENGEYKVELTVHTNHMNESARFTDEIPENFTAELIDAHNAEFSKEKNSVIFNWNKLPTDSIFTISYSVKSGIPGSSPFINGVFLYGDVNSDQTAMKELEVPLDNDVSIPIEEKPAIDNSVQQNSPSADTKNVVQENNPILAPEKGITFKVQISATQKSPAKNNDWFSSKYKINSQVEMTYHEGWKKYLVGSFQGYSEASNFNKQTREKVPDAFIVAYENGIRIPVKDAIRSKKLNQ